MKLISDAGCATRGGAGTGEIPRREDTKKVEIRKEKLESSRRDASDPAAAGPRR